jgi:hypothetical protein
VPLTPFTVSGGLNMPETDCPNGHLDGVPSRSVYSCGNGGRLNGASYDRFAADYCFESA